MEELSLRYASSSSQDFKSELTEALVAHLLPLQRETEKWRAQPDEVLRVLAASSARAQQLAEDTMLSVRRAAGYA
jgi:tryptophanyl-tRNA synthetase